MVPSEPGRASQEEVVLRQERRHRYVIAEPHIPFEYEVLYEDDGIIVIDKTHFLATTPRGMWYRETALIRLRERYGEPDIVPAHRLDRLTAGVVVFVRCCFRNIGPSRPTNVWRRSPLSYDRGTAPSRESIGISRSRWYADRISRKTEVGCRHTKYRRPSTRKA